MEVLRADGGPKWATEALRASTSWGLDRACDWDLGNTHCLGITHPLAIISQIILGPFMDPRSELGCQPGGAMPRPCLKEIAPPVYSQMQARFPSWAFRAGVTLQKSTQVGTQDAHQGAPDVSTRVFVPLAHPVLRGTSDSQLQPGRTHATLPQWVLVEEKGLGRSSLNKKLLVWVGTVSQRPQQGWVATLVAPQPLAAQFHELPLENFSLENSPSSLGADTATTCALSTVTSSVRCSGDCPAVHGGDPHSQNMHRGNAPQGKFPGARVQAFPPPPPRVPTGARAPHDDRAAWTAVLAALMALLIVATVLGNALVMLAFVADSSLRTQNNFFLLNLAISDFLVGAFCIPLYVPYVLTGRWTFGRGLCKLWLVVDYLLCTSSAFNIVLISYDRFLSVTRAVSYRAQQGNTRRAVRKMLLVWVLAFLLYGPAILSWEYLSGGSSIPEGHCYAEFFYNWYFLITASTLEFFTPFLSVTFFNLSIYLNIQRRTRLRLDGAREAGGPEPLPEAQPSPPPPPGCWGALRGGGGGGSAASPTSSSGSSSRGTERPRSLKRGSKPSASSASLEKRMKMVSQSFTQRFRLSRDRKVAKSLAVIVSIFGLCWAPYTLLMIIRAACHGHCVPDYWYETSFWLLWANSAVNPVLYPLCHHSFRRAFTKLLCPQKLKIQPHSSLEQCWKKMKKKTCL
ncbi:PREDICTED: histamine H3 receptor [Colobus angolensis palliatus]|uniref:histamine H3 receptor n=1 Tax=Colobus angolensis palliatus TaxID=336983 RepID=UPI0005F411CE|nr:PREDICTED: histamine H3 receptor [Colobus angolensis palliatus]